MACRLYKNVIRQACLNHTLVICAQKSPNALNRSRARSPATLRFSHLEKQLLRQHWHALATRLRRLFCSDTLYLFPDHVIGGFFVMDID
jgi:hypothetical protein